VLPEQVRRHHLVPQPDPAEPATAPGEPRPSVPAQQVADLIPDQRAPERAREDVLDLEVALVRHERPDQDGRLRRDQEPKKNGRLRQCYDEDHPRSDLDQEPDDGGEERFHRLPSTVVTRRPGCRPRCHARHPDRRNRRSANLVSRSDSRACPTGRCRRGRKRVSASRTWGSAPGRAAAGPSATPPGGYAAPCAARWSPTSAAPGPRPVAAGPPTNP